MMLRGSDRSQSLIAIRSNCSVMTPAKAYAVHQTFHNRAAIIGRKPNRIVAAATPTHSDCAVGGIAISTIDRGVYTAKAKPMAFHQG